MSTTALRREGFGRAPANVDRSVDEHTARRTLRISALAVLGISIGGLGALRRVSAVQFWSLSLFYEQFARIEGPSLWLQVAFVAVVLMILRRSRSTEDAVRLELSSGADVLGGLLVVLVALLGVRLIFHEYLLVDDENSAWFQAQVFAVGARSGHLPRQWCDLIIALTPNSITATPESCSWRLSFLPLHSLVQAPFIAAGVGRLGVPLLSGASVLLIASIARKLWPERPVRAHIAVLFMVTSTQVLFMSMTMFSMPTHLFFSLVWLWLYVDDRLWSNVLLPWIGVLALGTHSPFPHGLLIPPFVLRYVWNRRYAMFTYVTAVYVFGLMFWYGYLISISQGSSAAVHIASAATTAHAARGMLHLPDSMSALATAMHLTLMTTWSAPLSIVLAVAAMLSWNSLDRFSRDATLSILLMLTVRALQGTPQGAGWGYRFVYDGLSSLALLSSVGADVLARAVGSRIALRLVLGSAAIAMFVQLPLRALEVGRIVSPYRKTAEWLGSLDFDAVLFPTEAARYGREFVRNDPFLRNRPKIISAEQLTPEQRSSLRSDSSLTLLELNKDSLRAHGVPMGFVIMNNVLIQQ